MNRLVAASVALVLALGTTACTTAGQARPGLAMWQYLESVTGDDGRVGLQPALQAFSYLFRPLPGVSVPATKPDPTGYKMSGTGPIRWVFNHWPELTEQQRHVVAEVLLPPPDEPPRLRSSAQPYDRDHIRKALELEVENLSAMISSRLGVTIPRPEVYLAFQEYDNVRAWTVPLAEGERIEPGTRDGVVFKNGPAKRCLMFFPPSLWKNVVGGLPPQVRVTIAHEVFHCFQAFSYPDLAQYHQVLSWLGDGSAEFAATDLVQAAFQPSWEHYLSDDYPLFQRVDAAMGWWFHLQHLGHDPWQLLPFVWHAGLSGVDAYLAVGGEGDDVYDTWASSLRREPGFGDAWEVHGVDVPEIRPTLFEASIGQEDIGVEPFAVKAGLVSIPDDVEGVLRLSAANPVRVHDGVGFEDVHITEADYCLGPTCTCPDDTERAGEEVQRIQAPLWLAVPGGEAGNSVVTDRVSLQDYCRKKQPDRRKPKSRPQPSWAPKHKTPTNPHGPGGGGGGDASPDPQGKAGSVADPHLTTFDGYRFDFQAAGEFTLADADDRADLSIQVRQQPMRIADFVSDRAAVNTAVAASVAGDRVGFYPGEDRPRVRLGGTEVSGEQRLGGGGVLTPIDAGYTLRWPDGTELSVLSGSPDSLNVLVAPALARKGKLHGLLGPFDGKTDSTELTDRDGHRYERPEFDDLYHKIGDSWRISQSDSLFDYGDGESTDTFTNLDMPAKELTLADLTPDQRAAGERACAGVAAAQHDRCVLDVGVSGSDRFAAGYRALEKLDGGTLSLDHPLGPLRIEAGQQRSFSLTAEAGALYFASDADCTKATSATVWWRVTAPDGTETLQVPMCADAGRRTTAKPGAWRVDVWVPPGSDQGGLAALHVEAAGDLRRLDLALPSTVDNGGLRGAGAEDRYQFGASAGDKVTVTARSACDDDRALYWGLEAPDGNVITLRTRACQDLGQQTIPATGTWSVVIFNRTADEGPHHYAFAITRP